VAEESPYPISPYSPPNPLFDALQFEIRSDVKIIVHSPYMNKLLSRLIKGNEIETCVHFAPETIVALERKTEISMWEIIWAMSPAIISKRSEN
jgi:phosphohistidine phosphatase SixA